MKRFFIFIIFCFITTNSFADTIVSIFNDLKDGWKYSGWEVKVYASPQYEQGAYVAGSAIYPTVDSIVLAHQGQLSIKEIKYRILKHHYDCHRPEDCPPEPYLICPIEDKSTGKEIEVYIQISPDLPCKATIMDYKRD